MGLRVPLSPRFLREMEKLGVLVNQQPGASPRAYPGFSGIDLPVEFPDQWAALMALRLGNENRPQIAADILPWHEARHLQVGRDAEFGGIDEPDTFGTYRQWGTRLQGPVPARYQSMWAHDIAPEEIDADVSGLVQASLDQALAQRQPRLGAAIGFPEQLATAQALMGRTRLADLIHASPMATPWRQQWLPFAPEQPRLWKD